MKINYKRFWLWSGKVFIVVSVLNVSHSLLYACGRNWFYESSGNVQMNGIMAQQYRVKKENKVSNDNDIVTFANALSTPEQKRLLRILQKKSKNRQQDRLEKKSHIS